MKKKVIIILSLIFVIKLVLSCFSSDTHQNKVITKVFNKALFKENNNYVNLSPDQTINKEDFLLEIFFEGNQVLISSLIEDVKQFGFQSAYASVDYTDLTNINNINKVEVYVKNTIDNQEINITDDLSVLGYDYSISDYIDLFVPNVYESFEVKFTNTENILSSSSIFKTVVYLDDDSILEAITPQINFN